MNILRNLFAQLLPGGWEKDFPDLALRRDQFEVPPTGLRELFSLIERASKYYGPVTMAVDALDECGEGREELFTILGDLGLIQGVSIFVTSRKEDVIEAVFRGFPSISLARHRDKAVTEIEAYINNEFQTRSKLARLPSQLKEEIKDALADRT